jgi:hypothetical protein
MAEKVIICFSFLFLVVFCGVAPCRIVVSSVDGSAQIKREGSRSWEQLKKGAAIEDNDQIQTAFKGRCEISAGLDNTIILGSSSRMLVNVTTRPDKSVVLGLSLLSGSVYTRLVRGEGYAIYTSSAKATATTAIFNCTVDEITGITGFHVFRGDITLQNISIQGTQVLKPGETATVAPSTPPSIPRKINTQQMAVLTRFYGSDFINQELKMSGLEIETASSSGRTAVSVEARALDAQTSQKGGTEQKAVQLPDNKISVVAPQTKKGAGVQSFNQDALKRRIDEHIKNKYIMYTEPDFPEPLGQYKYRMMIMAGASSYDGGNYPFFDLIQSFYWKNASVAVHLPVVSNESGSLSLQIGNLRAVLDKIYHAELRYKSMSYGLGAITNATLGNGLLMRNYSNRAKGDNLGNLGFYGKINGFFDHLSFLTSSVSDGHLSAVHYYSEDPVKRYDVVVVHSRSEKLNAARGDFGFFTPESSLASGVPSDSVSAGTSLTGFEIGGTIKLLDERPYRFFMKVGYSGIVNNNTSSLAGYSLLVPSFTAVINRIALDAELLITGNRFLRAYWGQMYEDMQYSLMLDSAMNIVSANALYDRVDKTRMNIGTRLAMKVTPLRGTALLVEWEKNLVSKNMVPRDTTEGASHVLKSVKRRNDGAFEMRLQIGDGFRLPSLLWLESFYRIERIGYFEDGNFDPFTPNPFTVAGASARIRIRKNLNLLLSWERFYYDRNGNFISEASEKVETVKLGANIGF